MIKWYWYLAWKQSRYYAKQTAICVGGIAAAVIVLMVILSFSWGIESFLTERILLLTPHLTLEVGRNEEGSNEWQDAIIQIPGVRGSSPYLSFQGIMQRGLRSAPTVFKAVNWELENSLFNLERLLDEGNWAAIKQGNGLVVGAELARNLGLSLDTQVTVITAEGRDTLPVQGIFYTGHQPLDGGLAFLPLTFGQAMLGQKGISGYGVKVEDLSALESYILPLQELTDLWVRPWYEQEQSVFIALAVQKRVLIWIMLFTLLVSALGIMNIFLLRSWHQRRNVGIFQTLGATPWQIGGLFIAQGLYCGLLGGTLGLILARVAVIFLGRIRIHLPQVFYLEQLPIRWAQADLWWVLLLAVGTGLISVMWPAWQMIQLEPGEVLRGE